jgi:putative membrane protein
MIMRRSFWGNSESGDSRGSKAGESAMDILKKRYAKGEISKSEFEEMKKDI